MNKNQALQNLLPPNQKKKAPQRKGKKFTSLGKKKIPKKYSESEESKQEISDEENKDGKNSKKTKSVSKSKSRSRSRSKSESKSKNETSKTPTGSNKSTPSKGSGDTSSRNRIKESSSGRLKEPTYQPNRGKKGRRGVSPSPPGGKKIQASKVKESSSNIESSSSIDLSAEQKKKRRNEHPSSSIKSSREYKVGPESERIHAEVENVIKKIEDKKRMKKTEKITGKTKKGKSTALVTHTAKDFDFILQKNPNSKTKPFINLEDLSKHHDITYSDILLALLEVGKNSDSYIFAYSSKSRCFWEDVLQYTILKKIFIDFKAETLRKYWNELSKYDSDNATDLIKKNKSYLDNLPIKLGTIVNSITKLLKGDIKNLKEYIDSITMDIRKKELFEKEIENPVTGEKTKVKEIRYTYAPRKRYEPGNVKDFKGSTVNVVSLKEVYHQNSGETEFQKVMKNLEKEDSNKFTYIFQKIEEEKKKINTINEEDKFIFKAIDNVVEALSTEFKAYSTEFILETLRQNSMDIAKTYICLKEPMKSKIIGFTPLDDKVLLKKTGEEYKILLKEKGKEAIQGREEFLNH